MMKLGNLGTLISLLAILLPSWAQAQDTTAKVYPPHSVVHGKSLGEWGAEMWKWVYSLPKDRNPLVVPLEKVLHTGQSGPVYFLTATGSGEHKDPPYKLNIPEGKDIFIPLLDVLWYNDDNTSTNLSPPEIIKFLKDLVDSINDLDCTVDGVVIDTFEHREKFSFFQVVFPEGSVDGHPAGEFGPAAHDGYYLMIQAPPPGTHVIQYKGFIGEPDPITALFWLDLIYEITIVPASTIYFRRGDANGDGDVDISDPVNILAWLFTAGDEPSCEDIADSQDDGKVDLADAVHILAFLFLSGETPPTPGPFACGEDPTPDTLMGCAGLCAN